MSRFQPPRTSSPSKTDLLLDNSSSTLNASHSPAAMPELSNLSPDDIDVLDAVIDRAGPSSNTFVTVFTAYNSIVKERGLDPHEVLYYGKLLKLGTMKGKNWGEKWAAVKAWHNHTESSSVIGNDMRNLGRKHSTTVAPETLSRRVARQRSPLSTSRKVLSSRAGERLNSGQGLVRRPRGHTIDSEISSSALDDAESNSLPSTPPETPRMVTTRLVHQSGTSEQSDSDNTYAPSATPPSYRAATRSTRPMDISTLKHIMPRAGNARWRLATPDSARKRRNSVNGEADAWDKIRVQRDEAQADVYRRERLLERCWEVWKQGFQWIFTTTDQITEARNNLLLRISLQRWRMVTTSRRVLFLHISALSNGRCLGKSLKAWQKRLGEKRHEKWRQNMQQKRRTVQEKCAQNMRKTIWAKWCRSYRTQTSRKRYERGLVHRFYCLWKGRLASTVELEDIAENAFRDFQEKAVEKCWRHWRHARELLGAEQIISGRVDLRLMGEAISLWQKNARDCRMSSDIYRSNLMKATVRLWRTRQHRVQTMETRGLKHLARQCGVLVRAVFRIWKARERGILLERVQAATLKKRAWLIWQRKLQRISRQHDLASAVVLRIDSEIAVKALRKWRDVFTTHKNAHSFAVLYDDSQTRYRVILAWRIELRRKLKVVRVAKMANHFFVIRRSWKAWRDAMAAKAREDLFKEFMKRRLEKALRSWVSQFRLRKQRYTAERTIEGYIRRRTLRDFLAIWTNRVIGVKVRELEVGQDFDLAIQTTAFKRWCTAHRRHTEQLSLMENYLMVKREEKIRRAFNRWLTLTRITRRRRISLKEKEDEIKSWIIASSWDKWRGRFSDERLRPIEYEVLVQAQRNALFRAFGIWYSKTKSLPAVRSYARNTKFKYFKIWRQTIPGALQAREARERDKKAVLSKYLDKWMQSRRTKVTLKAVARARYLQLPTARQVPLIAPASVTGNPQKILWPTAERSARERSIISMPKDVQREVVRKPMAGKSFGWRASAQKQPEPSPERSRTSLVDLTSVRGVSPPLRSSLSDAGRGDAGQRSVLWHELREIGRKRRPLTLGSRSRSP